MQLHTPSLQPQKKKSEKHENPIGNGWNWDPVGYMNWSGETICPSNLDSLLVNNIYLRPTELDPGSESWRRICCGKAALDFPGWTAFRLFCQHRFFLTHQPFPSFLKPHLFPGHLVSFFLCSSFSIHVPLCQHSLTFSFTLHSLLNFITRSWLPRNRNPPFSISCGFPNVFGLLLVNPIK